MVSLGPQGAYGTPGFDGAHGPVGDIGLEGLRGTNGEPGSPGEGCSSLERTAICANVKIRSLLINDLIVDHQIDLLCLTETWLQNGEYVGLNEAPIILY